MRILLTGTSGGIGGAVASLARSLGHEVVALNRSDWPLERLPFDGEFDAVVFCTGMCEVVPLTLVTDEAFAQTLTVNCGYFLRLMRELIARKAAKRGMVALAISSISASEGWAGGAAYCASKGALSALCRALDVELKGRGIRVKALEPRYVATAMFHRGAGRMGVPEAAAISPEDFAQTVLAEILKG